MTDTDPCFLPVAAAAALIAAKQLSPVELTRAYLNRIEQLNGTLHAYVRVLHDEALAAARASEAEIMAGRYRGPLHGIPIGLKDIYDTAGVATEGGSKLCLGRTPTKDATVTRLLKEAGAVLLGKLTTWEFAIGGTAFDTPFPPARNPWNIEHDPAGSSSGSGAAVAAGLCAMAMGSDTGGSIPLAGCVVRPRRVEADLWPGQPRRHHAVVVQPRPRRAADLDGRGRGDRVAGDRRARPERSGLCQPRAP
jgi:aspartyl-tRNA(Asn)/glutamyl-tRNA(Gln) amidotransferase subunit A